MGGTDFVDWGSLTKAILVTYITVGLLLNIILFLTAKIRNLDDRYDEWAFVLTSIIGLCYFLILGSILWLPVMISYFRNQKKLKIKLTMWSMLFARYVNFLPRNQQDKECSSNKEELE